MGRFTSCVFCKHYHAGEADDPCVRCKHNYAEKFEEDEVQPKIVDCDKSKDGQFPEKIMVEFGLGNTAVYHLHVEQPKPVFVEIRSRQGYINQPMRRRRGR